jgi:hypothetical protein
MLIHKHLTQVSHNRMAIHKGHVFGLNLSKKGPINIRPNVNCYKVMDILMLLTELLRISGFNQWCHSMYVTRSSWCNVGLEDNILEMTECSPATSVCRVSDQVDASQKQVWWNHHNFGLYSFHMQTVQALKPNEMITLYTAHGSWETSSSTCKLYSLLRLWRKETEWEIPKIHTSCHLIILTHPWKHISRASFWSTLGVVLLEAKSSGWLYLKCLGHLSETSISWKMSCQHC